ncbi:MAG: response regulator transcription factor [Bacteroidales bacterium]|nr:response regulator transcription factor [Bacteroidales bacterium]
MRLLIIEDEAKVVAFLKKGLEENGYTVDVAYDGQEGAEKVSQAAYDIILLDLVLPHISGLELCRMIREKDQQVPILMLTALGSTEDKVIGFEAGADDYLTKPFEFKELLVRIRALVKRTSVSQPKLSVLRVYDIELDLQRKTARRGGHIITLTGKEFSLLEYLMLNKGRVLSRAELAGKVWDINFDTGTNVVDVYINILRKKIDRDFDRKLIHTRVGLGYIFDEE